MGTLRRLALTAAVVVAGTIPALAAGEASAAAPTAGAFVPVGPVRLTDTRLADCGCQPLDDRTVRVAVSALTEVPDDALAAAITVTAVPAAPGFVTAYPAGTNRPPTSTLNVRPDRVVANSTIVALADGGVDVFASTGGAVIVDLVGVFVPTEASAAGRFVAEIPTRLVDTRAQGPASPPGSVTEVVLPPVQAQAAAVTINVTHVGAGTPGHLSIAGTPSTSFLNTNGRGAVAGSVIAPVVDGRVRLLDQAGGHVVVDLTGTFTGPDAPVDDRGLFVPVTPTRLLDTRQGERVWRRGTVELAAPAGAAAIVTNLTITRPDRAGYVTAYPAGSARPLASAVNPAFPEHTLANLAITAVSGRGAAYYASVGTDLVVDLTGYFTGTALPDPVAPPGNPYLPPRVLVIGDSALRGVAVNPSSLGALSGVNLRLEAAGCRRLHEVSCTSPGISKPPPTALDVLNGLVAAGDGFDYVVITAGHNDAQRFDVAFTRVVDAARRLGPHTIIWQNYSALSEYGHLGRNSAMLQTLVARPGYTDVRIADWRTYTAATGRSWLWDGIHMTAAGAWAQTDYLARWIAAVEHRPCPAPQVRGGQIAAPCPVPDSVGPPADPMSLYR